MIGNKYITNRFATDYIQKYIYWVDQPLRSIYGSASSHHL